MWAVKRGLVLLARCRATQLRRLKNCNTTESRLRSPTGLSVAASTMQPMVTVVPH